MSPIDGPNDARANQPNYPEIINFIQEQNAKDRDLVDEWFKRATLVLSIIFGVFSVLAGLIGWKTIWDAKAEAQQAARERVQELLQEPEIQKLVRDEAYAMFAKGEFRQATEEQVRTQLPGRDCGRDCQTTPRTGRWRIEDSRAPIPQHLEATRRGVCSQTQNIRRQDS